MNNTPKSVLRFRSPGGSGFWDAVRIESFRLVCDDLIGGSYPSLEVNGLLIKDSYISTITTAYSDFEGVELELVVHGLPTISATFRIVELLWDMQNPASPLSIWRASLRFEALGAISFGESN